MPVSPLTAFCERHMDKPEFNGKVTKIVSIRTGRGDAPRFNSTPNDDFEE
jgi:hypothetical protein